MSRIKATSSSISRTRGTRSASRGVPVRALMTSGRGSGSLTGVNRAVRMSRVAAGLAAAVLGLAGCHEVAGLDKAGAARQPVKGIRLVMPDDDQGYGAYFAR